MTQPSPKHREEARELYRGWLEACHDTTAATHTTSPELDELVRRIAAALSARDQEIREVLEGISIPAVDGLCWCPPRYELEPHQPACLAARALYDQVQPVKEGNDGK